MFLCDTVITVTSLKTHPGGYPDDDMPSPLKGAQGFQKEEMGSRQTRACLEVSVALILKIVIANVL